MLLTGNGPSPKDGGWAFCSGGDQRIRGKDGYKYAEGETASTIDQSRSGRLHILEVQRLIRFMPKIVICVVPGWAAGGGHSLHVVADLTLASREHAKFKQTDADVASFDGGFGSAYLARQVGQKFAREIFFLGREYSADDAHRMGMVNAVVHGNRYNRRKKVYLKVVRSAECLTIWISDEGDGFNPQDVPDPLEGDNLLRGSGRGVMLMQAFMDEFQVSRREPQGTEVRMVKCRAKSE